MGVGIPVLANRLPEGAAAFGAILSAFGGGALVGAILSGSPCHSASIGRHRHAVDRGSGRRAGLI